MVIRPTSSIYIVQRRTWELVGANPDGCWFYSSSPFSPHNKSVECPKSGSSRRCISTMYFCGEERTVFLAVLLGVELNLIHPQNGIKKICIQRMLPRGKPGSRHSTRCLPLGFGHSSFVRSGKSLGKLQQNSGNAFPWSRKTGASSFVRRNQARMKGAQENKL